MSFPTWIIFVIAGILLLNSFIRSKDVPGKIQEAKDKIKGVGDWFKDIYDKATKNTNIPLWLLVLIVIGVLIVGKSIG